MNILVTGAKGFVGKNLISTLNSKGYTNVFEYDIDTKSTLLDDYIATCDFVFHLAGVNRTDNEEDFINGNFGFTSILLNKLSACGNKAPILITSSIQAAVDNPYGKSKKAGEELVFDYGIRNDVKTYVYRLPNVFGKWCRPNYNSVISTFCYNIARDLPIHINDRNTMLNLVYIDDVVDSFIKNLEGESHIKNGYCVISETYNFKLGEIADLIYAFKESRENRTIPNMANSFVKKLYSTYLSYLPEDNFAYPLTMQIDGRGSFTEFIKSPVRGQVSVNISKPGITKGNHWHRTKNEKFLVVNGEGVIRFRKHGSDEIIEYFLSGDKPEIIDIPPGYTHNIENIGCSNMVTIMWCNELYNKDLPDTYFLEV